MGDVLTLERSLYPDLEGLGLESALMGFCAAFHGQQDCRWVAEAGITATCVDTDPVRLGEMRPMYPDGWQFVCADIYEYAACAHTAGVTFDMVSLDPYTNQFAKVAEHIRLWCALANRLVVLGTGRGTLRTPLDLPDGWAVANLIRRSDYLPGGVFWAVLEARL